MDTGVHIGELRVGLYLINLKLEEVKFKAFKKISPLIIIRYSNCF